MPRSLIIACIIALSMALPALAQPTTSTTAAPAASAPAAATLPAVTHLVYQFGYNTKAASQGDSTGTTTFDITGIANDGGITVNGTDAWWMAVHPKQTNTCEVYSNGSVTCAQPPYAITGLQMSVAPLLGRAFFSPLSANASATWKQDFNIKATFLPGASNGFAGQVYTWKCAYTLTGKGTFKDQPPLILIHLQGNMKQQGGRYLEVTEQANVLYDPRINMPVYVNGLFRFVPQLSTSSYSVEMKLIKT
jgi:hypothetical protein